MRFDLRKGFHGNSKKATPKSIIHELLWFLKEIQHKVFTRKWSENLGCLGRFNGDLVPFTDTNGAIGTVKRLIKSKI
jgi:hypothetical protein